ncbi:AMP-binding protein [Micromonospora carbonacea]|uniref:AMP-binding protein n=1 Tax=Micromonospora carbonacea TaxID=47853 RepID=UPI003D754A4E
MGQREAWLTGLPQAGTEGRGGVVTRSGRAGWDGLLAQARRLAADLPGTGVGGWVVPADRGVRTVLGLLVLGLATPAPSWVLGDPASWAEPDAPGYADLLFPAASHAAAPPGASGATYATATSGSTGTPRLLFGHVGNLAPAVRLYTDELPEFAAAEAFVTCSPPDFAAAFYLMLLPALVLRRDLVLFRPSDWPFAAAELAGRPTVCLAPPALQVQGARCGRPGASYRDTWFVPAGGGMTLRRADRVAAGFPGCRFLTILGSTETGLLTVSRQVRDDGYVGRPLAGKPVWLDGIAPDGVGTLWTRGPDTRFAARGGQLMTGPDGAVSTGDLAHPTPDGGYVLDGRQGELVKVDGVSVYPNRIAEALRRLPGVDDVAVTVDRTGAADRLVLTVVGTADEAAVRAACAALPQPIVPHRVRCRADARAYTDRGKVRT